MISEEDREVVLTTARSYRPGAPMTIDDIMVAARLDGHPLDHVGGQEISRVLRRAGARCISLPKAGHTSHWILEEAKTE